MTNPLSTTPGPASRVAGRHRRSGATRATPVFLGLDLGTSSLKAVAVDAQGGLLARGAASYPTVAPRPGWAEQDPADWTRAAVAALTDLLAALPPGAHPRALGLAGQLPTLALLDSSGTPLRPAIVWYDGRAAEEAAALTRRIDAGEWYRRSGVILDAHYLAPMHAWVRRHEPALAARPHRVCSAKDTLLHTLTGEWATDPSTGSGYGVFDPVGGAWDPALCAAADLGSTLLPPVRAAETAVGTLAAARLGLDLPADLPVVIGAGDALAGVLGCGAATPCILTAIAGTSTSLVVSSERPVFDPGRRFMLTPHALSGLWGLEMDLLATGSAVRWLAETLRLEPGALLEQAATTPPGARGVVALPYLAGGEQGALWDPRLPAAFLGLSLGTTPADLGRALLEGIAFEMRRCLSVWQEAGIAVGEVLLSGGLDGPVFAAMAASVLDLPVRVPERVPASAYGAALLAGIGVGAWSADQAGAAARRLWGEPSLPGPELVGRYAELYTRHRRISATVREQLSPLP